MCKAVIAHAIRELRTARRTLRWWMEDVVIIFPRVSQTLAPSPYMEAASMGGAAGEHRPNTDDDDVETVRRT